ncbi:hypothetical protein VOLCADRAFT_105131 [Volvox carteri f. nagariensis]|uniref:Uncharacterized protein n=1 Tax=Volvox carteri f. nagariensis TaxID=3068 RepID=D8TYJ6_VOLCA|nr:uncharacterized protein VOLCADRAFT_105131 [Volvox carteri f. nagariensis]EFJ47321.1 hypothetical protein VOLCADRAFT_105131 [Volvox carteri f. nagariensis]|eukprot:XP_002951510.1 hypothetical protein VOLCADRAFT_105131 [Volvox carteri f. nagariensis]
MLPSSWDNDASASYAWTTTIALETLACLPAPYWFDHNKPESRFTPCSVPDAAPPLPARAAQALSIVGKTLVIVSMQHKLAKGTSWRCSTSKNIHNHYARTGHTAVAASSPTKSQKRIKQSPHTLSHRTKR